MPVPECPLAPPPAPAAVTRYYTNGACVIELRYEARDGRHLVTVGEEGRRKRGERFASIRAARDFWRAVVRDLSEAGFTPHEPF